MRWTNRTATDDRPNRPPKGRILSAASSEGRLRRVSIVLLAAVVLLSTTLPGGVAALADSDNVSGEPPDGDDLVDGSELTNETSDEVDATEVQPKSNETGAASTDDTSDADATDDEQPVDEPKTGTDAITSESADTVENQSGDSPIAETVTDDPSTSTDEETNSTDDGGSNESLVDTVDESGDETSDTIDETGENATDDPANATGTDSSGTVNATDTVDETVENATDSDTANATETVQNGTAPVDDHAENTTESADTSVVNVSDGVEDEVQNTTDPIGEVEGAVANTTESSTDSVANATNSVNESVTNATDVVSTSTSNVTGSVNENVDATTDAIDDTVANSTVLGTTVSNTTAVVDDGVRTTIDVVNESVSNTTVLVDESVATSTGTIDTTVETVTDTVNATSRATTDETTTVTTVLVDETTGLIVETVETTTTAVDGTTSTVTYVVVEPVETTTDQAGETIRPTTDLVDGAVVTSTELVNGTVVHTLDAVEASAPEYVAGLAPTESSNFVSSARVTADATTSFDETTDPTVGDPSFDLEGPIPITVDGRTDRPVQSSDDRLRTLVADERTVSLPDGGLVADESSVDDVSEPAGPLETLRDTLPDLPESFPDPPSSAATVGVIIGLGAVVRKFAPGAAVHPTGARSMLRVLARRVRSLLAEWLDRLLTVISIVGYSRYDDTDPLENERRRRLYEVVSEEPGIHVSRLAEETGIARSSVRYHLRILESENVLAPAKIRGKRRFYPIDVDDPVIDAALADDASAAVVTTLVECEPATVSGLAERMDLTPGTVTHHLQELEADGVIERTRDGRMVKNRLAPAVRSRLSSGERADVPDSTTGRWVDAVGIESDDD